MHSAQLSSIGFRYMLYQYTGTQCSSVKDRALHLYICTFVQSDLQSVHLSQQKKPQHITETIFKPLSEHSSYYLARIP